MIKIFQVECIIPISCSLFRVSVNMVATWWNIQSTRTCDSSSGTSEIDSHKYLNNSLSIVTSITLPTLDRSRRRFHGAAQPGRKDAEPRSYCSPPVAAGTPSWPVLAQSSTALLSFVPATRWTLRSSSSQVVPSTTRQRGRARRWRPRGRGQQGLAATGPGSQLAPSAMCPPASCAWEITSSDAEHFVGRTGGAGETSCQVNHWYKGD
jgi:hypothetical protein